MHTTNGLCGKVVDYDLQEILTKRVIKPAAPILITAINRPGQNCSAK
jgi:hypothetical protein